MKLDHLGNPIYTEKELFAALYRGFELPRDLFVKRSQEVLQLEEILDKKFLDIITEDKKSFDNASQSKWLMPVEYQNIDIEGYLVHVCPKENYQRLIEELQEFRNRNMLNLLKWLKYFVDTCRKNNVIWGVGRGSSVSSYVLYLIGVHKIDPIKYNLDWREFLR